VTMKDRKDWPQRFSEGHSSSCRRWSNLVACWPPAAHQPPKHRLYVVQTQLVEKPVTQVVEKQVTQVVEKQVTSEVVQQGGHTRHLMPAPAPKATGTYRVHALHVPALGARNQRLHRDV